MSLSELQLSVETNYGLSEEDRNLLSNTFKQIDSSNVGDDVLGETFRSLKERQIASELALASLSVAEGRASRESLVELYARLTDDETDSNPSTEEFVTDDLETLYKETWAAPGLRWRLDSLNKRLGSLRKGDFGFLMARPETGKTTFLTSEVSYMASQLKPGMGPIIHFNNEEQGNKVKLRYFQATLGLTLVELMSNREANKQKYLKETHEGQIKVYDNSEIHRNRVDAICANLRPSLIIFDQLDKIKGFAADREDLRLGAIYIWARELAKKYCPVIGICQADGTAEGVKYLTMDHAANAKTAKQAEADFIIGIGCVHDPVFEFVRYINIPKNKLQGDEDTDPKLRHSRFECLIRPEIGRYEDYKK